MPDGYSYEDLGPSNLEAVDGYTELPIAVEDWSDPNNPAIKSAGNLDSDDKIIIQLTANNEKTIYIYYSFDKEESPEQELTRFYDANFTGWIWGNSGLIADLGTERYVKELFIYDHDVLTSADWKLGQIGLFGRIDTCYSRNYNAPSDITILRVPDDGRICAARWPWYDGEYFYNVPNSPGDWFPFGCGPGNDAQNTFVLGGTNRYVVMNGNNLGGDNGCPSSSYGNPSVHLGFVYNSWNESDVIIGEVEIRIIPATTDIDPDTLNLNSGGKWITGYIELPEGYNVDDIDVSTVKLNDEVEAEREPTEIGDYDEDGILDLMVKFDRTDVQNMLSPADEVELTVTGEVAGTPFEGSDTIRVIDKGKKGNKK